MDHLEIYRLVSEPLSEFKSALDDLKFQFGDIVTPLADLGDAMIGIDFDDARCCQCEITGCHGNTPGAHWRDELSCSGRNGERDLVGVEESQGLKVCQECMNKYISGGYPCLDGQSE